MTIQINRHNKNGESISKQENQSSTPSGAIAAFYRAMLFDGVDHSSLDTMLEEDEIQEMKRIELDEVLIFKFKKSFKGIFTGRMDPVALSAGTEAILQTLAEKKRSTEEKKQENLTHQLNLAPETNDSSGKKGEHSGDSEMLLEALFSHSRNPIALATGLEAVLQTLAIKVFSKEEAEKKVFNEGKLLALSDLSEKAKRFLKHPQMRFPLLSFVCTRRELLEEVKELKNYIHELDAFIRLQPNTDEPRDSQLHSSHASKETSSSK